MTKVSNSPLKHKEGNYKAHKGSDGILYGEKLYHEKFGGAVVKEVVKKEVVKKEVVEKKPVKEKASSSNIMQPYIDSGRYNSAQLETIEKRLNNKKKEEKIKFEEKPKTLVESAPVEKLDSVLPMAATNVEAKEALNKFGNFTYIPEITVEAQRQKIIEDKAEGKTIDHNKLYTNTNPIHNVLRHDGSLYEGQSFWNLEEEDAVLELSKLYPEFNFEEVDISPVFANFEEKELYKKSSGKEGKKHVPRSYDAIKVTFPGSDDEIVIELDLAGFLTEPQEGWNAVKVENFNKLTNFIDSHLSEDQVTKRLKDRETNAVVQRSIRYHEMEPTDVEYENHLVEKNLTSTDIFNEKTVIEAPGYNFEKYQDFEEVVKPYGGYEKEIEEAKKQLIAENKKKAEASNTSYVEPTVEEIKQKALRNMQQVAKNYVKSQKYKVWMDLHEDFNDWDAEWVLERAKKEGIKPSRGTIYGYDAASIKFREKIRKEMEDKYYLMKTASRVDEAKAVLEYRANELQLNHIYEDLTKSSVLERVKIANAHFQDLNHEYPGVKALTFIKDQETVKLENGKIVPLEIWEQYLKDMDELQPMMDNFDAIQKKTTASINNIKENELQRSLIRRNYDDMERFQEVLGYGFANLFVTAAYGIPKFSTYGYSGEIGPGAMHDDEIIRWKNVVSNNRESFKKSVDFDHAFEDGNFGQFILVTHGLK